MTRSASILSGGGLGCMTWSRFSCDAKSPVFMLVRRDMCDNAETRTCEHGRAYNKSYAIFRLGVARPQTVCYSNSCQREALLSLGG